MPTIMVQMAHDVWTLQALHLACGIARNHHTDVTLVRMLPVQHVAWLGTELGNKPPTPQEYRFLKECETTVENYGVKLSVLPMQYISLKGAVIEAAHHLDAVAVFATLPHTGLAYWRKFQTWDLQRQLTAHHRMLYTLDQPATTVAQVTSIAIPARK